MPSRLAWIKHDTLRTSIIMHDSQEAPLRSTIATTKGGLTLALTTTALEALQPLVLVLTYSNLCNGLLFGNALSLVALPLARALKPQHRQRIASGNDRAKWSGIVALQSHVSATATSLIVACTAIALMLWECLDHREVPEAIPTMGALLVGLSAWIAIGPDQNTATGNNILLALIPLPSILYFKLSERFTQMTSL
jgi:hypothetical protein